MPPAVNRTGRGHALDADRDFGSSANLGRSCDEPSPLLISTGLLFRGASLQANDGSWLRIPAMNCRSGENLPSVSSCAYTRLQLFRMLHRAILRGRLASEAGNVPSGAAPRCVGSRILHRLGAVTPFMR
jgi:hypothetical protein